jgi:3'-phosphoadenosine 5'-phosphosulfate sulfotransferase (PAPS reductase)/FAD synthetase
MQPDLRSFDAIVINTSAGKDSQAMLDLVAELARAAGVTSRLLAVHANLGRVEWRGTRDLAAVQARHYGVAFQEVRRERGDLLEQVEKRGKWPDRGNRYCTSDQKRDQVAKVFTALARRWRGTWRGIGAGRPFRVLNCMGLRAAESPVRAKLEPLVLNARASSGRVEVWTWLPIHAWTVQQVWERIRASGVPHHPAYDLGMPRLSCCFCVFSSRPALILAGKHNPELLAEYVRVERAIGHRFRNDQSIEEISAAVASGESPGPITTWEA